MIYLRLAGGLGNQLFQLAAALHVHQRAAAGPIRLLSDGLTRYKTKRALDLARLLDLSALQVGIQSAGPIARIVERARVGRWAPYFGIDDERFIAMLASPQPGHRAFALMDGYFQHGWDWAQMKPAIDRMRGALASDWQIAPGPTGRCAIHVRGGDFLQHPAHQVVDAGYYTRAFGQLRERCAISEVLVVTDDQQHADRMLHDARQKHADVQFRLAPDQKDALSDFITIAGASSRVIGNSTFSWWAALLDVNEGLTVSPDVFVNGQSRQVAMPWEITIPASLPIRQ